VKIKVTYILYQINKALAFEWIIDHIDKEKFELSFISIGADNNSELEQFCASRNIRFHQVNYAGKKDLPSAVFKTFRILLSIQPELVHCHIFEGGLIGLTAAKMAGIKKRIYTRHYSTYHHSYAPGGVKYDKLINSLSTKIIAISENVRKILIEKENVAPEKIILMHHGFDLSLFYNISEERVKAVKEKYNPTGKKPIVGVVSRYTHWKGIQYIIPAFKKLLEIYPDALLVLSNAKGEYTSQIKVLLNELPQESFVEISFEQDNAALFKLFDVFVHVPIDPEIEAFGQIYIEALAVGIPSIFTLSGIAQEFIKDKENALVVDYHSADQVYHALVSLLQSASLRNQLIENGKKQLEQYFSLPLMIANLQTIYAD
jgi:glycosyltransferase involved in cell wall biosynthesis